MTLFAEQIAGMWGGYRNPQLLVDVINSRRPQVFQDVAPQLSPLFQPVTQKVPIIAGLAQHEVTNLAETALEGLDKLGPPEQIAVATDQGVVSRHFELIEEQRGFQLGFEDRLESWLVQIRRVFKRLAEYEQFLARIGGDTGPGLDLEMIRFLRGEPTVLSAGLRGAVVFDKPDLDEMTSLTETGLQLRFSLSESSFAFFQLLPTYPESVADLV